MSLTMAFGVLAAATLAALVGLLARHSAAEQALRAAELRGAAMVKELKAAQRQALHCEAEQQFLARLVRELPHVAHALQVEAGRRQIPKILLSAAVRLLEPRKAMVAVRRRVADTDPNRHLHLAVAAAFPDGSLGQGAEIRIGQGEIGLAAEVQRVMDRRDFENQPPATRKRLREETASGWQPDIVAPMVVNEEVVGVIAVEGLKPGLEAKDALRLLAQIGAASMHTQARYTEMRAAASVDGLTGVFNKQYLNHRLAEEMRRALDGVSPVSVVIFDLDHFKQYNDQNGHVAGDRLLQRMAKLVQENVRTGSVFGRYGGEEFLLILPATNRQGALSAAENLCQAIATHEFPFRSNQPLGFVSVSGGVAECPLDGTDAATLVSAADEALYQAKRGGRNRVLAYEPTYLGGEAQIPLPAEAQQQTREAIGFAGIRRFGVPRTNDP